MFKFLKDRIAEDLKYVDMLFTEMTRLMGLEDEHLKQRTQSAIFNQKTLKKKNDRSFHPNYFWYFWMKRSNFKNQPNFGFDFP